MNGKRGGRKRAENDGKRSITHQGNGRMAEHEDQHPVVKYVKRLREVGR